MLLFKLLISNENNYITRIVGTPGDVVEYKNQRLYLNGTEVKQVRDGDYYEPDRAQYINQYQEHLGDETNNILVNPKVNLHITPIVRFPHLDRKSTRLNSSHVAISYAVFCLKQKQNI